MAGAPSFAEANLIYFLPACWMQAIASLARGFPARKAVSAHPVRKPRISPSFWLPAMPGPGSFAQLSTIGIILASHSACFICRQDNRPLLLQNEERVACVPFTKTADGSPIAGCCESTTAKSIKTVLMTSPSATPSEFTSVRVHEFARLGRYRPAGTATTSVRRNAQDHSRARVVCNAIYAAAGSGQPLQA
jgi:hypothetical protein